MKLRSTKRGLHQKTMISKNSRRFVRPKKTDESEKQKRLVDYAGIVSWL